MRCQNCSAENPEGAKFAANALRRWWQNAALRATNKPGAKFCNDCGAPLNASAPAVAAVESRQDIKRGIRDDIAGERRHLTVLFCDLVGSTEIASHLDPEQWREIVGEYHGAAAQRSSASAGAVSPSTLVTGVMAYFGWPEAHDNDAERAARAASDPRRDLEANEHPPPQLAARVGIDSGTVVVGHVRKDTDVFGDTPNIAARVRRPPLLARY